MKTSTKQTPAEKAFYVLKKNLNLWDLKELIELIEDYVEEEYQKDIKV